MASGSSHSVIVLDFETTGLSPVQGDRAIEIGAVRIEDRKITERFSALMNPGFRVSHFIEQYTGISNAMLQDAPPCCEVMKQFADFIGDNNLVAHNASFDKRFLDAELQRLPMAYSGQFACSLLLSRRLFPSAPNHQLGTLVSYKQLPNDGVFHRALADAEVTAHLWLALLDELEYQYEIVAPDFDFMLSLAKKNKAAVAPFLQKYTAV